MVLVLAVFILALLQVTSMFAGVARQFSYFNVGSERFNITSWALNPAEWQHGLMNTTVTNSTIMIFEFGNEGVYSFWMYDTYSSLDIIWVNASGETGRVVYVAADAPTCADSETCAVYDPHAYANYVIEAKAGFAQRNNITVGTKVMFGG